MYMPILLQCHAKHPVSLLNLIFSDNLRVFVTPVKSHLHQSYLNDLSVHAEALCGSLQSYLSILHAQLMPMCSDHPPGGTAPASEGHCRTQVPEPLQENLRSL